MDDASCLPDWAPLYALWPLLLCAAHGGGDGRKGSFLEIGAFDGIAESNTKLLERCREWRGILVEGSKPNFEKLTRNRGGGGAMLVHAAASSNCSAVNSEVAFSTAATEQAGLIAVLSATFANASRPASENVHARQAGYSLRTGGWQHTRVPCRTLRSIISDALPLLGTRQLDFASIDVEGSENLVVDSLVQAAGTGAGVESVDDAPNVLPKVLFVEAVGPADKDDYVERRLLEAGYERAIPLEVTQPGHRTPRNRVFVLRASLRRCDAFTRAPPTDLPLICDLHVSRISLRCNQKFLTSYKNQSGVASRSPLAPAGPVRV